MSRARQVLGTVALLAFGPICMVTGFRELCNSRQLQAHGAKVQAAVVDGDKQRRKSSTSYYLTVSFNTASGRNVQKHVGVKKEAYESGLSTHEAPVYYLPEDPEVCAVGETVETKFGTLLGGIAMLGGGIFLGLSLRR